MVIHILETAVFDVHFLSAETRLYILLKPVQVN